VSAAYNFAERLPERRKMMQAWADYLDALKSGAEVIPLFKNAWLGPLECHYSQPLQGFLFLEENIQRF
jgi:hypothetical protein